MLSHFVLISELYILSSIPARSTIILAPVSEKQWSKYCTCNKLQRANYSRCLRRFKNGRSATTATDCSSHSTLFTAATCSLTSIVGGRVFRTAICPMLLIAGHFFTNTMCFILVERSVQHSDVTGMST